MHPFSVPGLSRRIGVEIEFAGLGERQVAQIICDALGGTTRADGEFRCRVAGTALGVMRVELDTAWRDEIARAPSAIEDLAHRVIPVEIITDPIAEADLERLETLVPLLRRAGAKGTRAGLAHGFGVHFNPEIRNPSLETILPVLQSYALLEPWLRHHEPMNLVRWALPFTASWPTALRRVLLDDPPYSMGALVDLYLDLAPSRNYGLDLLPLFRHIAPDKVIAALGESAPAPRPTYHFRLPSCRIDEADWSLRDEWRKWRKVEDVAARPALLRHLRDRWSTLSAGWRVGEEEWIAELGEILEARQIDGLRS